MNTVSVYLARRKGLTKRDIRLMVTSDSRLSSGSLRSVMWLWLTLLYKNTTHKNYLFVIKEAEQVQEHCAKWVLMGVCAKMVGYFL